MKRTPQFSSSRQIITIPEARKVLGSVSSKLSDDQIGDIIDTLHLIARDYLNKSGSKKTSGIVKSKSGEAQ